MADDNLEAAIAKCQDEDIGWGDFVLVGEATARMFPERLRRYIGKPLKDSDYRDAAGKDPEETAEKLARVLDGIATRSDVSADLGGEFEGQVEAGRSAERETAKKNGKKKHAQGRGKDSEADAEVDNGAGGKEAAGLTDRELK